MNDTLTVKKRWQNALRNEAVDRLPFWPKLSGSYLHAWKAVHPGYSLEDYHRFIGSDIHIFLREGLNDKRSRTEVRKDWSESDKLDDQTTVFESPSGTTEQFYRYDAGSDSLHPVVFPVRDRKSIRIMTEIYQDAEPSFDAEVLEDIRDQYKSLGDSVLTAVSIGESPLMHFIEHLAGVAEAHYLLLDYPEEVNELFDAMHGYLLLRAKLLAEQHPADLLYMIENTSTTLISPDQYDEYCLKHIREYEAVVKSYNRDFCLHMCGKLKDLLPALSKLQADAFEAFTAPPVGDTALLDGRSACPDTCLVGGTSAVTWTKSAAEIIEEIEKSLDELPHHRGIVLTSAGVMPPLCPPETIKEVCDFVKAYPAKL